MNKNNKVETVICYQLQRQRTAGAYKNIAAYPSKEKAVEALAEIAKTSNPRRPYDGGDAWKDSTDVHCCTRYRIVPLTMCL